jgi:mannose-6-phosphate isomerase-like protein (cupin superfamily)
VLNAGTSSVGFGGSAGNDGRVARGLPSFVPSQFAPALARAAQRSSVSASLLAAQIYQESHFNPFARSSAGALGIAQFMPATARAYGLSNPFDADQCGGTAATRRRDHAEATRSRRDSEGSLCMGERWRLHRRIAAVSFTLRNLKQDLEDVGSRFDGAPDLEFRLATEALELEQSGVGYQRVPPGYRFPYGHTHKKQEEVYVVVRGSGRMKLDDEIVDLKEWDAVRVSPGTWRGYEAGPEGLEIIVIGAPHLGEAPRDDVEGRRDWWTD